MSEPSKPEDKKGEGAKPEDKKGAKPAPAAPKVVGINPERLKQEFPDLTDEDLQAYVSVTQRLLSDPTKRVQVLEEVKAKAQSAQAKTAAGTPLDAEEALGARYMQAIQKMQKRPPAKA